MRSFRKLTPLAVAVVALAAAAHAANPGEPAATPAPSPSPTASTAPGATPAPAKKKKDGEKKKDKSKDASGDKAKSKDKPADGAAPAASPGAADKPKADDSKAKDKSKDASGDKAKSKDSKDKNKDKDKAKKKKKDDKSPASTPAPDGQDGAQANPNRLSLPLVEGHDSKGLKIPYYDTKGALQMMFNIGIATRLDNDHVRMTEMQVETYNEEGEPEMSIDLPSSVLDLNTRVITSQVRTTIRREDFDLTGDGVEFNTLTKQGKLVGNVHMTIYDLNEEAPSPTPEEKKDDAKPAQ